MSTGYSRRVALALAASAMLLPGTLVLAQPRTLTGTVVYRERIALPATAIVEVKLLDVSLADAPAKTIADTRIVGQRGSPIPFELTFDQAEILPNRRYALQARILLGDRLLFINTTRHPVLAGGQDNLSVLVEHVRGQDDPLQRSSPVGRWLAEDIFGGGVIDRLQSVLEVDADGAVTGTGGCNRIRGKATVEGAAIAFGQMATTQMACTPAVMDQERKFLSALGETRSFRIDTHERKLILLDANGKTVMRLAAM